MKTPRFHLIRRPARAARGLARLRRGLAVAGAGALLGLAGATAPAQTPPPSAVPPAALPIRGPEADALGALAPYVPAEQVSGTIRLWTRPPRFFGPLIKGWEEGFTRFQPGIKFEYKLFGTASVVGAVYTGVADVGVLGEEIHPSAVAAFERVKHHPPTTIAIATCNLDVKNFGAANIFYVNKDNPLTELTLAQLDGILGSEHRRGAGNLRTWGQLGLTGEWEDKPIHPYTWLLAESFCLYLQHAILEDSHQWSSATTEFIAGKHPDGTPYDDGEQILDAISRDRYGIGVSSATFRKPGQQVKPLALAAREGGPYYEATRENLIQQKYPLSRLVPAVIDHAPGQPIDPKVKEFMRFLLSRDGQGILVRTHGYLPLNKEETDEQLRKLLCADDAVPPPSPTPAAALPGTIRITGDDAASSVVKRWTEGFRQHNPDRAIKARLLGTGTGMAGIYTGTSDIALMGRGLTPVEHDAYTFASNKAEPLGIEVMTGSLDRAGNSAALVAFVHSDNPVAKLTLAQLDGIIGTEHRRGPGNLRTWGELGLTGEWADKPIRAYVPDQKTGTGAFLDQVVTRDSSKWDWEHVKEFKDIAWDPNGYAYGAGQQILDALARDRYGIAVSTLGHSNPKVKPLALSAGDGGPYVEATRDTLVDRTYPLTRAIAVFISRSPGKPADPDVAAFLRYVLSPGGQDAIVREGGFLPLSADSVREQLKKLE